MIRRTGILTLTLVALPLTLTLFGCTRAGAWDELREKVATQASGPFAPWEARLTVTFDTSFVTRYLFDVPVLVRLNSSRIDYQAISADPPDIGVFSAPRESSGDPLDWELSRWDRNGDSLLWVRVPQVSPGVPVILEVYFGAPGVGPAVDSRQVWRNGYVAVLHFDDSSDIYRDSSPFENHGVNGSASVAGHTPARSVATPLGRGIDFDDATDAILFGDAPSLHNMRPFSLSTRISLRSYISNARLLSKGERYMTVDDNGGTTLQLQTRIQHYDPLDPSTTSSSDPYDVFADTFVSSYPTDQWKRWTWTWNGRQYDAANEVWVDGNRSSPNNFTETNGILMDDDSGVPLVIGNGDWNGADIAVDGTMDELRLAVVHRSGDWIRFQDAILEETVTSYGDFEW